MSEQKEFTFDKFVEDIVRREEEQRQRIKEYAEQHSENPARDYNRLYREKWQNRVHHIPNPNRGK